MILALVVPLFWAPLLALASDEVPEKIHQTIFGDDGRGEIYRIRDANIRRSVEATAVLMTARNRAFDESEPFTPQARPYGPTAQLCPGERFYSQPMVGHCSGTLVGRDLVLTAGHCIKSKWACKSTVFAFGWGIRVSAGKAPLTFAAQDLYRCAEIVHSYEDFNGADFAVIRLDRAVEGREPIELSRRGTLPENTKLYGTGHPHGLPLKISLGGFVRDPLPDSDFFEASLDASGGNSGGAVFNSSTHEIEGVVVRGGEDFVETADSQNGACSIEKRCSDYGCLGEQITRAHVAIPYLEPVLPRPELTLVSQAADAYTGTANARIRVANTGTRPLPARTELQLSPSGARVAVGALVAGETREFDIRLEKQDPIAMAEQGLQIEARLVPAIPHREEPLLAITFRVEGVDTIDLFLHAAPADRAQLEAQLLASNEMQLQELRDLKGAELQEAIHKTVAARLIAARPANLAAILPKLRAQSKTLRSWLGFIPSKQKKAYLALFR